MKIFLRVEKLESLRTVKGHAVHFFFFAKKFPTLKKKEFLDKILLTMENPGLNHTLR